jgi:hypothetical protein
MRWTLRVSCRDAAVTICDMGCVSMSFEGDELIVSAEISEEQWKRFKQLLKRCEPTPSK